MIRTYTEANRVLATDISDLDPKPVIEDISVVIPTLGRPILLSSLLEIARGTVWPRRVIVVDQGRRADIGDWAARLTERGFRTVHVPSGTSGKAAGLNVGLRMAETRFVAVTDDDCFVDAKWIEHMRALLAANPGCVVTGRVLAEGDGEGVITVASMTRSVQTRPHLAFDSLSGGNLGASEDVFRGAGFFDEDPRLRTAEDAEWAYRVLRAGFPIRYSPELAVRHVGWREDEEQDRQYGDYARSHGGFYGKYIRRGDVFIVARAAVHLIRATRRWARGSLARDASEARIGMAYATGLIPGILRGLKRPVSE